MRILLSVLLPLFFISTNPLNNKIKLKDNQKVESTFSGNINEEDSFHLIITKDKKSKTYSITPYVFKNQSISELKPIPFSSKPIVLSFHNNEGVLSLITKSNQKKDEFINVYDISLSSGEFTKSEKIDAENFTTIVRKKDRNILLFSEEESITVLDAFNAERIDKTQVKPNESSKDFFKNLNETGIEAVNNQEFVANGPISKFRVYGQKENLILTREESKTDATSVVKIPLAKQTQITVDSKPYELGDSNFKKNTSYVANEKLYQLKLDKKAVKLDVFSLVNSDKKSIDFNNIELSNSTNEFKGIASFLKQASRGQNEPTVTVNKTKKGNLKVRVDYVNRTNYNYRYNWWWHHNWHWQFHQQMMQQQMMRQAQQNIPRFGPSANQDVYNTSYTISSKSHFEFVLDSKSEVVSDDKSESEFIDIDKKKYIKSLDDNSRLKYVSTLFTKKKFRYISFSKRDKVFTITDKTLDD